MLVVISGGSKNKSRRGWVSFFLPLPFFFLPFFLIHSPKKWRRGSWELHCLWGSRRAGAPLDPLLDLPLVGVDISWSMPRVTIYYMILTHVSVIFYHFVLSNYTISAILIRSPQSQNSKPLEQNPNWEFKLTTYFHKNLSVPLFCEIMVTKNEKDPDDGWSLQRRRPGATTTEEARSSTLSVPLFRAKLEI